MNPDHLLSLGLLILFFAIPSVVSAYSDRRAPRASALTILIAGAMILYAANTKPGGYRLADIPDAVARSLAQVIR